MLLLSGSSHNTNHAKSELGIYTTDQTGAFEITFSLMGIPFSVPSDSSPCEDRSQESSEKRVQSESYQVREERLAVTSQYKVSPAISVSGTGAQFDDCWPR